MKFLHVTSEQFAKGYVETIGDKIFEHRTYEIIERLPDGSLIVRDPETDSVIPQ